MRRIPTGLVLGTPSPSIGRGGRARSASDGRANPQSSCPLDNNLPLWLSRRVVSVCLTLTAHARGCDMATATLSNIVCETDKGLSTVPLVDERAFGLWQKDIPAAYRGLGARELTERIGA